jgi:hypothetical protein
MYEKNAKVFVSFTIINPLMDNQTDIVLDSVWRDTFFYLLDEIEDLGYEVTNIEIKDKG